MARIRPLVTSAVAWVLGAAAAVGVGLTALSFIGTGMSDRAVQPLSSYGIEQPSGAPSPSGGADIGASVTSSPHARAADQTLTTDGGTVIATCQADGAYLVGWSPAPGYRAKDVVRGPGDVAKLKFDGTGREIKVSVRCAAGVIVPKIEEEEEDDD